MQSCRITSVIGFLSLMALAVAAQTPRTTQDCFKRGLARYEKGDYRGALEDYTRAIELSSRLDQRRPDDDRRANVVSSEAVRFDNVRVLDPATAMAYANRGLTRYQLADYEGALQDCNRALAIQPRLTEAFNNRGMVWFARREYDRALRDLERAIVLSPREPELYNNRGGVRMELNDYGGALSDFNEALRLNPRLVHIYYNRGLARRLNREFEHALQDFDQVIKLAPQLAEGHFGRGLVLCDTRQYELSITAFTRALELNPAMATASMNRGLALLWLGRATEAEHDFASVLATAPDLKGDLEARIAKVKQLLGK